MHGCWAAAGYDEPHVSVLAGLRAGLPDTEIRCASGVTIADDDRAGIDAAVGLCEGSDAVLLCLGEASNMSGEAASRANPDLLLPRAATADTVLVPATETASSYVVIATVDPKEVAQ
jgi:beta-glucosidase